MFRAERVEVPVKDRHGRSVGIIEIHLLPGEEQGSMPSLLDRRDDPDLEPGMAGVQLLEGREYRYRFLLDFENDRGSVSTDRPEIFRPDTTEGLAGRIHPGLYTGTLPVNVFVKERHIGSFELEVRASKLDYFSHYQWMLRDLADVFAEVIMRRFAPTEARFTFRSDADAATLYQRFSFLKSLLADDTLGSAMAAVFSRPHREWQVEREDRPVGRSIPAGPTLARAIAKSGPRVPWRHVRGNAAIDSLPMRVSVPRSYETYDTLPNRFVKHALTQWRNIVADILSALKRAPKSATTSRGRREAEAVLRQLDDLLAQPLFRQVGPLTQAPAGNQVLEKRPGYRELHKLYVQSELAAMLSWSGGDDVYRAGQKDVAVLYEYWVFIQLAHVVSTLCQQPLPLERFIEKGTDGLDVRLKRRTQQVVKGIVVRHGRRMELELWYNRTFPRGKREGSWTRQLRPDCSLRIRMPGYDDTDELWIHFDAKYRIDSLMQIFDDEQELLDDENGTNYDAELVRSVSDDLLKMHAYRDAVRRSSGAYVIYPGNQDEVFYRYHEILPGLGAFALRPRADGPAYGLHSIRRFLSDVLDHVATQDSQHERHRYWEREIFRELPQLSGAERVEAVHFLTRPPADTVVLLGYVRDEQHYRWINTVGLYNLRADDRTGSVGLHSDQLAAEIVVLYGPSLSHAVVYRVNGDPRILNVERMLALDYPNPGGTLYLCLPVESVETVPRWMEELTYSRMQDVVQAMAPDSPHGAPVVTTWEQLVPLLTVRTSYS